MKKDAFTMIRQLGFLALFFLNQQLKQRVYEGLLYNEEYKVSETHQPIDMHKNTSDNNKNEFTTKNVINKTNKTYIYLGTCWKCNEFGKLAKECKNNPSNTNQTDHIIQEQTMINTYRNACSTSPVSQIKNPTINSSTKPPIITQQIITDFQLSQEAWNQLSSQMNAMVETNKLLKKVVQYTYERLTNVQNKPQKSSKLKENCNKISRSSQIC